MQRNNLMMDKTMQSAITDNNTQYNVNEDCIKQAESLLQMFKQGGQFNKGSHQGESVPHGNNTTYLSQANECATSNASMNIPLQQRNARARMGSTQTGIPAKASNANNSMISQ
jgi:hypothetical protein